MLPIAHAEHRAEKLASDLQKLRLKAGAERRRVGDDLRALLKAAHDGELHSSLVTEVADVNLRYTSQTVRAMRADSESLGSTAGLLYQQLSSKVCGLEIVFGASAHVHWAVCCAVRQCMRTTSAHVHYVVRECMFAVCRHMPNVVSASSLFDASAHACGASAHAHVVSLDYHTLSIRYVRAASVPVSPPCAHTFRSARCRPSSIPRLERHRPLQCAIKSRAQTRA
jgi:hypothetical protein